MAISAEITGQGGATADVQSDGGAETFNFGSLREQALTMMEGTPADSNVAPEQAELTQEPVPQAEPVAEATTVDASTTQAQLAALKDDDVVEVEVDGEKVQMPWAQARGGVMRQAKFTKSMQQLARDRESFETERGSVAQLKTEREALVTLLKNEQLLEQFLRKQYPNLVRQAEAAAAQQQAVGQGADPDDIATVGQIEAARREAAQQIQNLMNDFRRELKAETEKVTVDIEDRQASAKLGLEVNNTIKGLFKEHPYLEKVIPNAEDMLRYQVALLKPQTEAEVIEGFKTVVGGWVENYKATLVESNKQAVIQKHKLTSNNIQPPGGAPVQPKAQSFITKTRSGQQDIDWNKLREAAKDMLS